MVERRRASRRYHDVRGSSMRWVWLGTLGENCTGRDQSAARVSDKEILLRHGSESAMRGWNLVSRDERDRERESVKRSGGEDL
jgi:hypothetical protein